MRSWIIAFLSFKACALALAWAGHPGVGLVVFFAPDPWLFLQFIMPGQQAFGPAVTAFETTRREVWLTIDDGPDPATTPVVLDLLRRHGAKATFFVIGRQVAKHPELVRQIAAGGHTIGNHTHTHPALDFWCAAPGRIASEIDLCVAELLLADVPFERFFRPPVGIRNPFVNPQLASRAMEMVLWNARGFDGAGGCPQAALARIAKAIRPGGILLAHESGTHPDGRLRFVELLLEHLGDAGYTCVLPARDLFRAGG